MLYSYQLRRYDIATYLAWDDLQLGSTQVKVSKNSVSMQSYRSNKKLRGWTHFDELSVLMNEYRYWKD